MYDILWMFSILLQIAKDILNSVNCTAHFSGNFNSAFSKEIGYLEHFLLITKSHYISH